MSRDLSMQARASVFVALTHMAVADGRLDPEEVEALRAAAELLELRDVGLTDLRGAAVDTGKGPPSLAKLPFEERAIAVAWAAWLACADYRATMAEEAMLARIAVQAGLDPPLAEELAVLAWQIRLLSPEGMTPGEELATLRSSVLELLDERVSRSADSSEVVA
ncbi:MAG: TerB family tellurite resistance protein [Myxococcales bacterium]|nr:TerB family tellurite resistance protein [Myxococcales bacterium]